MADEQPTRWIDHVGITVPDLDAATRFFEAVFGARTVYETMPRGTEPFSGAEFEALVGVPGGTRLVAFRMLKLATGPGIELFEYQHEHQRPAVAPSDVGVQHFAVHVHDMERTLERIAEAGGQVLSPPQDLPGPESGPGNRWCYTRAPWGMTIELIEIPISMAYEQDTPARRWHPLLHPGA